MGIRLGILGATGNVGLEIIQLLENWDNNKLPIDSVKFFGSSRSAGKKITFRNQEIIVLDSQPENLGDLDLIISTANGEVSEKLVPEALKAGVKLVIDTDSYYRMDTDVPLVMAGANDKDIDWHKGIIAGPNCTVSQLIIPLQILEAKYGIERVVVSTYQAISGAGKQPMDKMLEEAKQIANSGEVKRLSDDQVAFNVVPVISELLENDYSKEEMKVIIESRKMLGRPDLKATCTAVRVPVLHSHSEAVNIQLKSQFEIKELQEELDKHEFVKVWKDSSIYPMPLDLSKTEPIHVGRIRKDESQENTLDMWIVADNLWIGAALNALRVAESAYQRNKII